MQLGQIKVGKMALEAEEGQYNDLIDHLNKNHSLVSPAVAREHKYEPHLNYHRGASPMLRSKKSLGEKMVE